MQVDASRQQQQQPTKVQKTKVDYMKFMHGKCFGCGSKEHTKKNGHHERDVCNHCGKTGHRSPVCFMKYLGKPGKSASAAAMSDSTMSTQIRKHHPLLRFVSYSVSCRVIHTYMSPLSLSAVSSHVIVRLLIPRTPVVGFLGSS